MRKASPNTVIDRFLASTSSALSDWQTVDTALEGESVGLRRRVASDAFLALAVSWESFLSQWLIAAVNKDSSNAVIYLTRRVRTHAEEELGLSPAHLSNPV